MPEVDLPKAFDTMAFELAQARDAAIDGRSYDEAAHWVEALGASAAVLADELRDVASDEQSLQDSGGEG